MDPDDHVITGFHCISILYLRTFFFSYLTGEGLKALGDFPFCQCCLLIQYKACYLSYIFMSILSIWMHPSF